jgi:hypothetical protein
MINNAETESYKTEVDNAQKWSHTITHEFILGKPKEGENPSKQSSLSTNK